LDPIGAWADAEAAWLVAHPADPCYQATYDTWQGAVDDIQQAYSLLKSGVTDVDPGQLEQGLAKIKAGTALLDEGASTINQSKDACGYQDAQN